MSIKLKSQLFKVFSEEVHKLSIEINLNFKVFIEGVLILSIENKVLTFLKLYTLPTNSLVDKTIRLVRLNHSAGSGPNLR